MLINQKTYYNIFFILCLTYFKSGEWITLYAKLLVYVGFNPAWSHTCSKLSHVTPTLQKNHAIALSLFTLLLLLVASNNACKITDKNKPRSGASCFLCSTSINISIFFLPNCSYAWSILNLEGSTAWPVL